MLIGVPREVKEGEFRVGLIPSSVQALHANGHQVMVQQGAGEKIGFTDQAYQATGASIVKEASAIFEKADMIVKVKEPQPQECQLLRENQILLTYLHLAANEALTQALIASKCVAIAYETVTDDHGGLPLLAPMSEVAGRMSIQAGATSLEAEHGGRGVLLTGVTGVPPGKVVILGAGVVGSNALRVAVGLGARVVIFDKSRERLQVLSQEYGNRVECLEASESAIQSQLLDADLVIGAVLVPGASAPKLVPRSFLKQMQPGAVLVDVAIDQGGCFETSRPTTHANPTFIVDGIVHYCVTNMPGAVARTSTIALNHATLPFVLAIANQGYQAAMKQDMHLRNGLNICCGEMTHRTVAEALHLPYVANVCM